MSKDNSKVHISLVEKLNLNTVYTIDEESKSVLLAAGGELAEGVGDKLLLIFEAAVNTKVRELGEGIASKYDEILEAEVTAGLAEIDKKVDGYLSTVVEDFFAANKPVIAETIQATNNSELVNGIVGLLKEHFVEIPEERRDILEESVARIRELEEQVNTATQTNVDLRASISAAACAQILANLREGLADTEQEKLNLLVENLDTTDPTIFEQKATQLKVSFFATKKPEVKEKVSDTTVVPMDTPAENAGDDIAKAAAQLRASKQ